MHVVKDLSFDLTHRPYLSHHRISSGGMSHAVILLGRLRQQSSIPFLLDRSWISWREGDATQALANLRKGMVPFTFMHAG
jgi:hypothetical protein